MLHDPDALIMDEPTDGLDPNQKHEVRELIKEMAEKKAIIISTHVLEEVDSGVQPGDHHCRRPGPVRRHTGGVAGKIGKR